MRRGVGVAISQGSRVGGQASELSAVSTCVTWNVTDSLSGIFARLRDGAPGELVRWWWTLDMGALNLEQWRSTKDGRTAPGPRGAYLIYIALALLPCQLSEPGPCLCPSFCRAQAFLLVCLQAQAQAQARHRYAEDRTGVPALVMSWCRQGAGVGLHESGG
jgi:hypothetical protein